MLRDSRPLTLLVLATAVAGGTLLYLLAAERAGFPLDDAWIHQTYARSVGWNGRWAFVPGVVSAGSTAPLWTVLLAVGYALRLPHVGWAWSLGAACLLWLAWLTLRLWQRLWPAQAASGWVAALVVALLWPLLWSALSGMETLLFGALALAVLNGFLAEPTTPRRAALLGLLLGLLVLTRPDGVWLAVLLAAAVGLQAGSAGDRFRRVGALVGTAVVVLLPYFVFNWGVGGQLWPNTLVAKQAEYAVGLARPFLLRFAHLLWFSLGGPPEGWRGISGAQWLLLPGLVLAGWRAVEADWRTRRLWLAVPLLWALGHVALFAWRLPVTYQHGRYLLPVLPIWVLYGLAGWRVLLVGAGRGRWMARRVFGLTLAVLLGVFVGLGARAYAEDVAFIDAEMVAAAKWIAANTPSDAVIAAHDIGALGYFAPRPLVDLGGLTDTAVVDQFGDEAALIATADYLVTAPGWPYDGVVTAVGGRPVFDSDYAWTVAHGRNNVQIFRLSDGLTQ